MNSATAITPYSAALKPLFTESSPRLGSTLISSSIVSGALSGLSSALAMVAASSEVKSPVICPLLVMRPCKTGAESSLPSRMIAICLPMFSCRVKFPIAEAPSLLKPKRIMGDWVSGSREG